MVKKTKICAIAWKREGLQIRQAKESFEKDKSRVGGHERGEGAVIL